MTGFNVNVPEPNIYPLDNETRTLRSEEEISIISDDGYTVYYSLDGSDPKDGFKYEEPFTINETLTVCARAKKFVLVE